MSEQLTPEFIKLLRFVNASADLAEGVERDIKNGKKISSDTVLRLSKYVSAAKSVANLLDQVELSGAKLQ